MEHEVNENVILYESYHGKNFTGNPLAIFLHLRNKEEFKSFTHVLVANKENPLLKQFDSEPNVKVVAVDDHKYVKYLATAKYLINNTSFPYYFTKRDEQVYINTWHGTPLKTLGLDIKKTGKTAHMNIQRNLLQTDILISPNQFTYEKLLGSHDIKEIFSGKIADIGYPRVDLTLNTDRQEVLNQLGIEATKKVVLYAPTWRGTVGKEEDLSEQLLSDVMELKQALGDEYEVLLKSHYFAYKFFESQNLEHVCVPDWMDTNMLLAGTDLLITDYSSIFFEFLPTNNPIIFYGQDIESYSEERGFYLPLDTLPGPVCSTIPEVIQSVMCMGELKEKYSANYKNYQEQYCYNDDGNAVERFTDIVFRGNESDYSIVKTQTAKEKILMYCGAFYNNGITMSAITLLDSIDYDKYEVVVVENPKGNAEKWNNISKVNENVHFIYRPGVLNRRLFDSYRHQLTHRRGVYTDFMEKVCPKQLYYNEFRRIVGNTKFDYVINFGGYNDFWSLLIAFSKVPVKSIYLHNDMEEEFNKKIKGKFKHKKTLKVIFSTYKYYDKVISVAESTHETNYQNLKQYIPGSESKMTYVNNLVNSNKVVSLKDQYELIRYEDDNNYIINKLEQAGPTMTVKGIIQPKKSDINFITIGRLSPEKGHEKLIYAFHEAFETDPNVKLYIVGEGPLRNRIASVINKLNLSQNVFLVGQLENPFALVQQCDCFVLSSNYEGQGLVLLEAMIIGKPIIATDVTGVRSVLKGGYGKLVENSQEALKDSLANFANQKRNATIPGYKTFDYEEYNKEAINRFYQVALNK